jgi:hypothetical protein
MAAEMAFERAVHLEKRMVE